MSGLDLWRDLNRGWPVGFDRWVDDVTQYMNRGPLMRNDLGENIFTLNPVHESKELDEHFEVEIDLPGMKKEDVHIEFDGSNLVVWGERKSKEKTDSMSVRRYGKFRKTFSLPENVDAENIEAFFEDGVLRFEIPKKEEFKPRKIKIKSGGGILKKIVSSETGKNKEKGAAVNA